MLEEIAIQKQLGNLYFFCTFDEKLSSKKLSFLTKLTSKNPKNGFAFQKKIKTQLETLKSLK